MSSEQEGNVGKPAGERAVLNYRAYIWHEDTRTLIRADETLTLTLTDEEAWLVRDGMDVEKVAWKRTRGGA